MMRWRQSPLASVLPVLRRPFVHSLRYTTLIPQGDGACGYNRVPPVASMPVPVMPTSGRLSMYKKGPGHPERSPKNSGRSEGSPGNDL
ncbi:hypothetical protein [Gracilimonas mengyeensis]|uniref:hypothetical protein n=1 Tax=Gracilimonas mengyeensis TaxID=1302730 RepID=UPI00115724DC|nr:hypothetical protein [Gracilimonas mengyeensis]